MIDIEKVVSGINYNGNPMELAGGGLQKIGTATTVPTGGTSSYGQIAIPAVDGIWLLINPSVTPDNSNRLPWVMVCYVNTETPTQSASSMTFNYGSYAVTPNVSYQEDGVAYFNSGSTLKFSTLATFDIYKLY